MSAPVVTVRGEATLEGSPDLATLWVTVYAGGSSAERTRAALATAAGRTQDLVREYEAAVEESSTSGFQVAPVFDRRGEVKAGRFRGSFTSTVVVKDFEALSPLVLALAQVPESEVSGPNWSLRRTNPIFAAVRLAAIDEALRRADDYAAAFGTSVVDLLEVSDLEPGYPAPTMRSMAFMTKGAPEAAPEFDFEPAKQTVSAQVTVRCTLAPPDLAALRQGRPDSPGASAATR
ncbi:hypothetical protein GCM10009841_35300 [Microlunatus panaciterrae]|uniref:Uncharacterized protein YggE n=1 Tax=Microlunatus panaciterrae TaxID=400768 RepID=A0ABS2RI21_9ACTN|nr:SIMPL domain-containing protein [Microlunatus panaciterrae]MBM7798187.1 uncharacterized protein YggE [Microlunatus panaciterrae]